MAINKAKWRDLDVPDSVQLYAVDDGDKLIPVEVNQSAYLRVVIDSGAHFVVTGGAGGLLAGTTSVGSQSGGTVLSSGVVTEVKLHNLTSGDMWINQSGIAVSGDGFILKEGETDVIPIDNLNKIYLISPITSGKVVSWRGVVA
jgi:hypothetical protein